MVENATKLETNYNRTHESGTRFEVPLRDAWVERRDAYGRAATADSCEPVACRGPPLQQLEPCPAE